MSGRKHLKSIKIDDRGKVLNFANFLKIIYRNNKPIIKIKCVILLAIDMLRRTTPHALFYQLVNC